MSQAPPRVRGFDRPLSANQLWSWVGNAAATAAFYAITAWLLIEDRPRCSEATLAYLVAPHVVCVAVGLACWLFLETHAPTEPSCFAKMLPETPRWTKTRYCREHKAVIAGLDHFCTWLNVAIGRQNYPPFFTLAAAGCAQYALHVAATGFVLVACREALPTWVLVVDAVVLIAGLAILVAYAALFGFHAYLAVLGIGTYDWILDQRADPAPARTEMAPRGATNGARVANGNGHATDIVPAP